VRTAPQLAQLFDDGRVLGSALVGFAIFLTLLAYLASA